ncbi:hypothetical protein TSUD_181650 [Trifolium subterraneum]|uniref:Uncharacterized protein n=1 Tax=Trifolium subterraneum TaxID=3900 RepID=A0A2Z6PCM5_TRISU|nr:hypothetical protein TSUD_181650 [Trifolium subterraneum]
MAGTNETSSSRARGKGSTTSADPIPDPEQDDVEDLCVCEADFTKDEEVVACNKPTKLEGPSWTECAFEGEDLTEFPGGPKDTSVLLSYGRHIARYIYKGYVSLLFNCYDLIIF